MKLVKFKDISVKNYERLLFMGFAVLIVGEDDKEALNDSDVEDIISFENMLLNQF